MEELFKEHNDILRKIAEGLDALATGQNDVISSLDEIVNVAEEIQEALAPVAIMALEDPNPPISIPGFELDPLKGFPEIRKRSADNVE